MEFTEGKIKKGETLMEFLERFYLEAQTLVSMGAATFVDVKEALLNYVHPNLKLLVALKSGIYGAQTVPELMHHLGSFKEQFKVPFPDYKKSASFPESEPKNKSWEKDPLKNPSTTNTSSTNNTFSNRTCSTCGKLGNLLWVCKQPKAIVCHLGHKESKDGKQTEEEEDTEEDGEEAKKLLSSQVEEKPLTASSNQPSPPIDPDPDTTDCDSCLLDQEVCLKRYFPDKEEINLTFYTVYWPLTQSPVSRPFVQKSYLPKKLLKLSLYLMLNLFPCHTLNSPTKATVLKSCLNF
ncbi:hypothetical protein DSO57_1019507 [Entomophthora muscae]|uniref:Uncharacterized protein n=1 Tax=Entomophthora muscae TaxID=34485 RepID=A0ACC2TFX7_9FUNG|nr:hypothetical protein DSO57_1019507 [Entomophthora muscae]